MQQDPFHLNIGFWHVLDKLACQICRAYQLCMFFWVVWLLGRQHAFKRCIIQQRSIQQLPEAHQRLGLLPRLAAPWWLFCPWCSCSWST